MSKMSEQLAEALNAYQTDIELWGTRNFGGSNGLGALAPMMGIVEEVGELYHTRLKTLQGIRGAADGSDVDLEEMDALGDLLVYMLHYCATRNLSLASCFLMAWDEVKDRDWIKYPKTGKPA